MKKLKFLFLTLALLGLSTAKAQFEGREGKNIKQCDCNKMLDSLNVRFKVPSNVSSYSIIGFRVFLEGKQMGYVSYSANRLKAGEELSLNLLTPLSKGRQSFPGREYDKFKGRDIRISYSDICERKGVLKMKAEMIGISQVGTQTEYKYDEARGAIIGKTRKLYDNGTSLQVTPEIDIVQQKVIKTKFLPMVGYVVGVVAIAAGVQTAVLINPKN